MKKILIAMIMCLFFLPNAYAQETGFASTPDEILRMLTDDGGRAYLKIEFEVNSAQISQKALMVVDSLGQALTDGRLAQVQVKLVGHTDSAGSAAYNRELSLKRARAVMVYLNDNYDIAPSRISIEGKGEDSPIAPNATPEGRAMNRRVEVINTGKKETAPKGLVPDPGKVLFE